MHTQFNRKLLKSSVLSIISMYSLTVGAFWLFGVGNELQYAMTAGAAIVAAILLPIVYLLWGLPVHLAMQKIGISSVAMYSVAGALPGAVFVTVFKPFGLDSLSGLVAQSMFCSFIGTTGAIVLWYYQVYKNA